ncbi:hypothetical protein NK6_7051 [Bradyrhizobium diazoefficiens]|uniref:Uncharacterized protein n=1 Tax=Bradyrhizobium diazoefficiens TaxID=1355477 RepID=A0A0E4BTA3_9BRAD|nr:hypothetical protein NK6_7051 [Bradyrhizobium diazoefficiens]
MSAHRNVSTSPGIGLRGGDWGRAGFIPGWDDDFVKSEGAATWKAWKS